MIEDKDFTIDERYQELLQTILDFGKEKKDRTGTGTKSIFGYTIRHDMTQGFPLLTTKKMAYKSMITELKWFLKGDTNIKYLVDNNCNIWNGDAYKKYHQAFPETEMLSQEQFINLIKTNDEFEKLKKNDKPRIRFVSRNASIYKDSPTTIIFSKGTKKKKESFLEFLGRAPISFGGDDE